MSNAKITHVQQSTLKRNCCTLDETVWERHLRSHTTGSMNSIDTSLRWHVCPCSLYCTGSMRVHLSSSVLVVLSTTFF